MSFCRKIELTRKCIKSLGVAVHALEKFCTSVKGYLHLFLLLVLAEKLVMRNAMQCWTLLALPIN